MDIEEALKGVSGRMPSYPMIVYYISKRGLLSQRLRSMAYQTGLLSNQISWSFLKGQM